MVLLLLIRAPLAEEARVGVLLLPVPVLELEPERGLGMFTGERRGIGLIPELDVCIPD